MLNVPLDCSNIMQSDAGAVKQNIVSFMDMAKRFKCETIYALFVCVCMSAYVCAYVYAHVCICVCTCVHMCVPAGDVCACMCMRVCMHVSV